jgi:hypothetical protein
MFRALREQGLPLDESHLSTDVALYNGDLLALGRGEIFLRPGD